MAVPSRVISAGNKVFYVAARTATHSGWQALGMFRLPAASHGPAVERRHLHSATGGPELGKEAEQFAG
jgi:hypothetical protein